MRKDTEKTQYSPKDLADQPAGQFLLRFEKQGLPCTVLWVDGVTAGEVTVQAWRFNDLGDQEVIAAFSRDYTWFMLDRDLVDLATVGEILDRERINMLERAQMQESLLDAYKRGLKDPSVLEQRQQGRNRFLDEDDFRRLMGGE